MHEGPRSAPERQWELARTGSVHEGWRSGPHAVLGQESGDSGLRERSLDPAHRPAATRARVEIGAENVTQKPGPTVTWWRSVVVRVVVATEGGKAELFTAGRMRPSLGRVAWMSGNDFPAHLEWLE